MEQSSQEKIQFYKQLIIKKKKKFFPFCCEFNLGKQII